jgi:prepilin-type N-terminal cleavage/methylation domain-containing protein
MSSLKNKQGMTVIEVLVTILIAAIIFGMVASIVGFFSRFYSQESQYVNRQENMRTLMLQIERDIRMSDQEVNLVSAPCYTIGTGTSSTPSHIYCFNSSSGTVSRNGNVIARNVSVFNLTLSSGGALNIDIRMIPDARGKQLEAIYTIFLRQAGS